MDVNSVSAMVDQLTALERVATTPIPISCEFQCHFSFGLVTVAVHSFQRSHITLLADGIHLKQCITLYLFALPFTLVQSMQ